MFGLVQAVRKAGFGNVLTLSDACVLTIWTSMTVRDNLQISITGTVNRVRPSCRLTVCADCQKCLT